MNERIRKIAMSVQRERHWTEEDIEKFAELIIQECVDVCNRQARAYAETNNRAPATYTANALGRMIRMHFEGQE